MTTAEAKSLALIGAAVGVALGVWNVIAFWLNPLDDSVAGMLIVYAPMILSWSATGFVAGRRSGRLAYAVEAAAVFALGTFCSFWMVNIVRVNLFLHILRELPGWQKTMVARYHESGFQSFRAFTNYEYVRDAPLKILVPTMIGALLGGSGGLAGVSRHRTM